MIVFTDDPVEVGRLYLTFIFLQSVLELSVTEND